MNTTEIVGFKREDLGKSAAKALRADGNVPCVVYGGGENIHFHAPAYLFKDLVYTPDAYFVKLNIEGVEKTAVLQDIQFHPVSEIIVHADFLEISEDKPVAMNIPVKIEGRSKGEEAGGVLQIKTRELRVKALPKDMPQFVTVDVSPVELAKSFKVAHIPAGNFEILNAPSVAIASVIIPRALRQAMNAGGAEEEAEG